MSQTADLQNDNDSIRKQIMTLSELDTLMLLYARRGINDWNQAGGKKMRRRASQCIGVDIADNEKDVERTIRMDFSKDSSCAEHLKFIPMPKFNTKGIERCFFSPIARRTKDGLNLSFDLFILVARTDCLAFRFEPSHGQNSPHSYPHAQLSRELRLKTIRPTVPCWLPNSYPAFPIPARDPLGMFLSMAVAVHGFRGGVEELIKEMFQEAQYPSQARKYVKRLENMLGIHRPTPESSTGTVDSNERSRP